MKRAIKLIALSEFFVLLSYFISFTFYINLQIAYLSSLFIILGASFAYKKMVNTQVEADVIKKERDFLDELEDPHGLYDDEPINEAPPEELDLKAIVQEEKKKIKIVNLKDMKNGSKAGFSLFRLVPYLFLVLGFIALKNNELLNIFVYLPSLLVGIVVGYLSSKEIFA
ncbi:MAG: hypothetical protein WC665_06485 [Sulfurimonas sp.]